MVELPFRNSDLIWAPETPMGGLVAVKVPAGVEEVTYSRFWVLLGNMLVWRLKNQMELWGQEAREILEQVDEELNQDLNLVPYLNRQALYQNPLRNLPRILDEENLTEWILSAALRGIDFPVTPRKIRKGEEEEFKEATLTGWAQALTNPDLPYVP